MLKSEPMAFLNFSITNSYLPVCLYMCVCVHCVCARMCKCMCACQESVLSPPGVGTRNQTQVIRLGSRQFTC